MNDTPLEVMAYVCALLINRHKVYRQAQSNTNGLARYMPRIARSSLCNSLGNPAKNQSTYSDRAKEEAYKEEDLAREDSLNTEEITSAITDAEVRGGKLARESLHGKREHCHALC